MCIDSGNVHMCVHGTSTGFDPIQAHLPIAMCICEHSKFDGALLVHCTAELSYSAMNP